MKRTLWTIALLTAAVCTVSAQETSAPKGEKPNGEKTEERDLTGWQWANFAILLAGLGYLAAKNVPPMLRLRSQEIRSGMEAGARAKAEADAQVAEIEKRVANLPSEIERLRKEMLGIMETEGGRIREETSKALARIEEQARQEITFLGKTAQQDLKAHSAALALAQAQTEIVKRMTPETQHNLTEAFVHDLTNTHQGASA